MTKTSLRTTTNQAPARRKPTTPPTTRRDQPRKPMPSCPRIDVEKVAKVPAEVSDEESTAPMMPTTRSTSDKMMLPPPGLTMYKPRDCSRTPPQ